MKKVAESAAAREEQLVNCVVFLARNVRGKYSLCHSYVANHMLPVFDFLFMSLHFCFQKRPAYPHLLTHRLIECHSTRP